MEKEEQEKMANYSEEEQQLISGQEQIANYSDEEQQLISGQEQEDDHIQQEQEDDHIQQEQVELQTDVSVSYNEFDEELLTLVQEHFKAYQLFLLQDSCNDCQCMPDYSQLTTFLTPDSSFLTPWSWNPDAEANSEHQKEERKLITGPGSFFSYDVNSPLDFLAI
ncbi:conserved hypothetical protein [Ricinus communis]|uniref:Uncharacterized protein n=1 Tax=Ricinus communis TaxID=3988 RepID=B9SCL4_RICCO|nr:conserved hypothetical protein [Ricinus communis]